MDSGDASGTPAERRPPSDEFVQLFTKHQRRLFLYILGQVGHPVEAEEVLQETNLIIWNKYDQFEPGSNFGGWVSRIAHFEILKHRERRQKNRLRFSDEFVAAIAAESDETSDLLEQRRDALIDCLRKLRASDRELIEARYRPDQSGQDLAKELGRPRNSVYQSLGRIRRTLFECINRRIAEQPA